MKKASEQIKITGLYIELTSQCNLRCLHCYNESGVSTHRIDVESFQNIIKDIENPAGVSVTLSGGEPLLHPDLWKFIEILYQKGFGQILIITNATLVTKEVAEKLKKYGVSVQVSLNGSCADIHDQLCGKGNFDKTLTGLKTLKAAGINRILVRYMLAKFNSEDLIEFLTLMKNIGITHIDIAILTVLGRSKDNLEKLYLPDIERDKIVQMYKKDSRAKSYIESGMEVKFPEGTTIGCPYLNSMADEIPITPRISADGLVHFCQLFSDEKYAVGSIKESNTVDIFKSNQCNELIDFFRLGVKYMNGCDKCVWKSSCGRGCIALCVSNGSIQETDGNCYLRKKQLLSDLK